MNSWVFSPGAIIRREVRGHDQLQTDVIHCFARGHFSGEIINKEAALVFDHFDESLTHQECGVLGNYGIHFGKAMIPPAVAAMVILGSSQCYKRKPYLIPQIQHTHKVNAYRGVSSARKLGFFLIDLKNYFRITAVLT